MNELIGKYLNGYKIVRIEKDPFIKEQINLWTDEEIGDFWGDRLSELINGIIVFIKGEDELNDYMYGGYLINTKDIKDILKEVE